MVNLHAFVGPYQKQVIVQNTCNRVNKRTSVNTLEGGKGKAYIRMGELGHMTSLLVKRARNSPDPSEHGDCRVLLEKNYNFLAVQL